MKTKRAQPAVQLSIWDLQPTTPTPPKPPKRPDYLAEIPPTIPGPNDPKPDHSLLKQALETAAQNMQRDWKGVHLLALTSDESSTSLEYLRRADGGPSALRISRNPDGLITTTCCGEPWPGLPMDSLETAAKLFSWQVKLELTRRALRDTGILPGIASFMNHPNAIRAIIDNKAISVINTNLQDSMVRPEDLEGSRTKRPEGEETEAQRLVRHFKYLLRTKITDPKRIKAARKSLGVHPSHSLNAMQHNAPESPPLSTPLAPGFGAIDPTPFLQQAIHRAKPDIPRLVPVSYQEKEDGTRIVDLLWSEKHTPQLTVKRHPEGHITLSDEEQLTRIQRLLFTQYSYARRPTAYAAQIIAAALAGLHPNPAQLLVKNPMTRHRHDSLNRLTLAAREILDQKLKPALLPKGFRRKPVQLADTGQAATRLIRAKLADPATFEAAFGPERTRRSWLLRTYNHLALNAEMLAEHAPNMPAVVSYYEDHVLSDNNMLTRLESPGQMVTIVREHLKLDNNLWKAFTRLEGHYGWGNRQHIPPTCRALAEANRPNAPRAFIHALGSLSHLHSRIFGLRPQGRTQAWEGWIRCVNRFLDIRRPYQEEYRQQLQHMGDALIHLAQVDPERVWGPGSWDQLYARAQAVLERQKNDIRELRAKTAWNSALQTATIDGVTFTALTDGGQLDDYGDLMGNCLGSYTHRCSEGKDRVFAAHGEGGQLLAAVQLHNYGAGWKSVQVEGPRHSRGSAQLKKTAEALAQRYDQASRRQTSKSMQALK